jgi:plasmid maintenance system antidote protein VapI
MRQEMAAMALGVTREQLSRLENGRKRVTPIFARRLRSWLEAV